jgi:hypothetical protein
MRNWRGFKPIPSTNALAWSQQDEEHLKALRKAELATRILAGRKAMRQAEELRRAIQELEARKQAMLAIMLPKVSSEETMSVNSKVATEELTAVDKLPVDTLKIDSKLGVDREVDIDKQILELASQGKSLRQIAEITKLSHEGVRRRLKRLQKTN